MEQPRTSDTLSDDEIADMQLFIELADPPHLRALLTTILADARTSVALANFFKDIVLPCTSPPGVQSPQSQTHPKRHSKPMNVECSGLPDAPFQHPAPSSTSHADSELHEKATLTVATPSPVRSFFEWSVEPDITNKQGGEASARPTKKRKLPIAREVTRRVSDTYSRSSLRPLPTSPKATPSGRPPPRVVFSRTKENKVPLVVPSLTRSGNVTKEVDFKLPRLPPIDPQSSRPQNPVATILSEQNSARANTLDLGARTSPKASSRKPTIVSPTATERRASLRPRTRPSQAMKLEKQ